ncbi:MAG: PaaI family thioesterase [Acidobacteriota bacterium]
MNDTTPARTRTVSWTDPLAIASAARGKSGKEILEALIRGEVDHPPFAHLLGLRLIEVGDGLAVFSVEPAEFHYNPIGVVHGGLLATALDSAMGCAVHSTLPMGTAYTTLEIKANFVRPATMTTGPLRCEARVIHRGKTSATAEGKVVDGSGRLYAHGTTTCMIFGG